MKQTLEDLRFAGDFADALRPHVTEEKNHGKALKKIAEGLGVTEPALKKYLLGKTTPCLRTVILAFDKYGVSVPYSGISLFDKNGRRRVGKKRSSPLQQLFFPFEIETPANDDRFALKLLPIGVSRYQLQVRLKIAR
jgi:transcriptional regulator with XRE-family HTH domain